MVFCYDWTTRVSLIWRTWELKADWFTFLYFFLNESVVSVIFVVFGCQAPLVAGENLAGFQNAVDLGIHICLKDQHVLENIRCCHIQSSFTKGTQNSYYTFWYLPFWVRGKWLLWHRFWVSRNQKFGIFKSNHCDNKLFWVNFWLLYGT